MPAEYPAAVATIASDKTNNTVDDTDHPNHHNKLALEVVATQTTLGTNPQGGSTDVKTRIAATETVANAAVPTSTKGAASGVASLDGSALVPRAQLGTGSPSSTTYLAGDGTWKTIATSALMTGSTTAWTVSNYTVDRVLNQDSYTLNELADALCTLVADLQTRGVLA